VRDSAKIMLTSGPPSHYYWKRLVVEYHKYGEQGDWLSAAPDRLACGTKPLSLTCIHFAHIVTANLGGIGFHGIESPVFA
jgi:hypothetical protein